jgi:cytochrome c-type biogenesis protein CcmH/NrfG
LLLQHRENSARALCQRALAADPGNAAANVLLGDISLDGHHLGPALLEYEKAMMLEPHSREAIDGLTAVYRDGSMNLPMLRKLEKLASNGNASSRLMEITGRLYASQGMSRDAMRCLRRAVEIDPSRDSAVFALAEQYAKDAHLSAGSDLMNNPEIGNISKVADAGSSALIAALQADQRRDTSESVRQYEAAVRAGDPTGIASNNLAWAYAQEGMNLDRALALARHAAQLHPADPAVLDTLGVVQVERRQFTDAIESLKTGARLAAEKSGDVELQHTIEAHLRKAYEFAGQTPAPTQSSK